MTDERRSFYRIDDRVLLSINPIDTKKASHHIEQFYKQDHLFSIRNNFNFEIEQHLVDLHKIQQKMPEMARYLGVLEKQIDRLSDRLVVDQSDSALVSRTVSLSLQGVCFYSDDIVEAGGLVEVEMKLLPSGYRLLMLALVIDRQKVTGDQHGSYRIALQYEHIHEADREILARHIHQVQLASLSNT